MSKLDNLVLLASLFEKRVIEASAERDGSKNTSSKRGFNNTDLLNAAKYLYEELGSHLIGKILNRSDLSDNDKRRIKTAVTNMDDSQKKAMKEHVKNDVDMALLNAGENIKIILENLSVFKRLL